MKFAFSVTCPGPRLASLSRPKIKTAFGSRSVYTQSPSLTRLCLFCSPPSTLKQLESLGLRCERWLPMPECGVRDRVKEETVQSLVCSYIPPPPTAVPWTFDLLAASRKPSQWQTDGVQNAGDQEGFQGGPQHSLLRGLRHRRRLAHQRQQSSHRRLQRLQEPGPKARRGPHQSKAHPHDNSVLDTILVLVNRVFYLNLNHCFSFCVDTQKWSFVNTKTSWLTLN